MKEIQISVCDYIENETDEEENFLPIDSVYQKNFPSFYMPPNMIGLMN